MSYIKLPTLNDLKGKTKELAEDAISRWGYFPNIERAYALAPEIMNAEDVWSKGIMNGGYLKRDLKEAIATVVSSVNSCSYCASSHAYANTLAGSDREKAVACSHFDFSRFDEKEKAALKFSKKAALDPKLITRQDIEELSQHYNLGEIVEISVVIQQFMGYNWFVTMLGLQIEDENPIRLDFKKDE